MAAAISSFGLLELATIHSMFDWPEQTQTSPTRMLFKATLLLPVTVILNGPPAFGVGISIFQLPILSAFVDCFALGQEASTFICSPGSAQPQIGTVDFCCKTMLFEITAGNLTSASDVMLVNSMEKQIEINVRFDLLMASPYYGI